MSASSRSIAHSLSAILVFGLLSALQAVPLTGQQRSDLETLLSGLELRSIGPATMGGRIADLAIDESDPATFYVGAATGGLWKTTNHGASFEPVFEDQPTSSVT